MKNIFICIIILLLTGIVPILSCKKYNPKGNTCEGEDLSPQYFIIKSMATKTILFPSNTLADTTLHYNHDGIVKTIYIDKILTSLQKHYVPDFSLIPQALACSPMVPTSKQKITSLFLISKTSLVINPDTVVTTGDTLNNLFKMTDSSYPSFKPIETFLIQDNHFYENNEEFYLKLIPKPEDPIVLTFDIKIRLSDGTNLILPNERLRVK